MNEPHESPLIGQPSEGELAPEIDGWLIDWGREVVKRGLQNLIDSCARLVTLNTALLGGSLFFLKELSLWSRVAVMACFSTSLIAALWGAGPAPASVDLQDSGSVRGYLRATGRKKLWAYRIAATALLLGFVAATIGLLNSVTPTPPTKAD